MIIRPPNYDNSVFNPLSSFSPSIDIPPGVYDVYYLEYVFASLLYKHPLANSVEVVQGSSHGVIENEEVTSNEGGSSSSNLVLSYPVFALYLMDVRSANLSLPLFFLTMDYDSVFSFLDAKKIAPVFKLSVASYDSNDKDLYRLYYCYSPSLRYIGFSFNPPPSSVVLSSFYVSVRDIHTTQVLASLYHDYRNVLAFSRDCPLFKESPSIDSGSLHEDVI